MSPFVAKRDACASGGNAVFNLSIFQQPLGHPQFQPLDQIFDGIACTAPRHEADINEWLLMDSGELLDQQFDEGSQQCFSSSSHVVNELEESQVQR